MCVGLRLGIDYVRTGMLAGFELNYHSTFLVRDGISSLGLLMDVFGKTCPMCKKAKMRPSGQIRPIKSTGPIVGIPTMEPRKSSSVRGAGTGRSKDDGH
jgi:hypothetical protein